MPYIGKAPSSGIRSRFIYTATAAQTTFTGADGNGKTLGYTDGEYVDVYLNGVLLDPADYTATSKTSVVLDSGAAASDIVEIVVYDTFSVFNGTFTGDLTVDGDTLFVDASADAVGIGTTSGFGELNVKNSIQVYNDNVDGASHTDATIGEISSQVRNFGASVSTARFSSIKFCIDPSTYYFGDIRFFTNGVDGTASAGTERMRILSGGGLTFNGDTAAANALDDYEEGTWTPTYAGTTTNPTITYHSQTRGNYTKIGNLVIANVEVITDSVSGGSGTLAISGLPFTASSLNRCGTGMIGFANNFATSNHPAGLLVIANSTDVYLYKRSSTDAQAPINTALTTASLSSGSNSAHNQIIGTIVYRTD